MAKHTNSVQVQTPAGVETLTKVSTHRDYTTASAVQFEDGTQLLLSWHLTEVAAIRYTRSAAAQQIARYEVTKHPERGNAVTLITLPVSNKVTGKGAPEAPVAAPEAEGVVLEGKDPRNFTAAEKAAADAKLSTPKTAAAPQQRECRCQCGQQVQGKKSEYLPGHDARHASSVARLLLQGRTEGWDASELNSLVDSLGSEKLKLKALAQAHRLGEKAAAKAAK